MDVVQSPDNGTSSDVECYLERCRYPQWKEKNIVQCCQLSFSSWVPQSCRFAERRKTIDEIKQMIKTRISLRSYSDARNRYSKRLRPNWLSAPTFYPFSWIVHLHQKLFALVAVMANDTLFFDLSLSYSGENDHWQQWVSDSDLRFSSEEAGAGRKVSVGRRNNQATQWSYKTMLLKLAEDHGKTVPKIIGLFGTLAGALLDDNGTGAD